VINLPFKDPDKNKKYKQDDYQKNRKSILEKQKKFRDENPELVSLRKKIERTRTKTQVMTHYSNSDKPECFCCGETQLEFLTLDHRNNDGNIERKKGLPGGARLYDKLKAQKFPEGYQVMCFNCNCGRAINNGICPHKTLNVIKLQN